MEIDFRSQIWRASSVIKNEKKALFFKLDIDMKIIIEQRYAFLLDENNNMLFISN